MRNKVILFVIYLILVFLDQYTKIIIENILPLYSSIEVFKTLNITHIQNKGVAFGLLANLNFKELRFIFIAIYIIIIFTLLYFLYKDYNRIIAKYGYIMILAGATGNLIDRIRIGKVIDFIDFHIHNWHYPAFNIADSSITIGIIILLIDFIFLREAKNYESIKS
ncbi:MAG: signal peptidase II [Deferribacterota bacterium]|nr:signal peptidase II [Deferribacterota bacterium]